MKKTVIILLAGAALCLLAAGCRRSAVTPGISIFCDHIETAARQEGIPFAEAAAHLKALGCTGADIRVLQDPDHIHILDSLGFAHACAITDIDYSKPDQRALEDRTLAFMAERGFDRLLLVPGLVPDSFTRAERDTVRARIAAFSERVKQAGYTILVEDFDNRRSLCYNSERLDSLFAVAPALGLVFDSGNFPFAGLDPIEQLEHFRGRIGHVHLKDRASLSDMTSVPAGTGCVPVGEIIARLRAAGYDGWLTVEQYGSRHMLDDASTAIRNVRTFID